MPSRRGWATPASNQRCCPYWVDYASHFGQGVDVDRWHRYYGIPNRRGLGSIDMTVERACFYTIEDAERFAAVIVGRITNEKQQRAQKRALVRSLKVSQQARARSGQ